MRMICDGFILDSTSMGSPGIEEVRWLKPLRPGTTIRVRTTVLDTRASGSRPEMGLTKFMMEVLDDGDAIIASLTTTLLFRRREPGAKS
jgi:acyl dehydratase